MSDFSTKSQTQTGVGVSDAILFTNPKDEFQMLINAYVTGEVTYNIEYTIDPAKPEQYVTLGDTDRVTSSDDAFYFPMKKLRVNVTAGTGTVKLVVMYKD